MSKERFKIVPAAFLVLKDDDGRVLLSQRFNTGFRDGDYSLAAGHIEQDETATDAMIREAKEEIGVVLERENLHMNYMMYFGGAGSGYYANFFFFRSGKVGRGNHEHGAGEML